MLLGSNRCNPHKVKREEIIGRPIATCVVGVRGGCANLVIEGEWNVTSTARPIIDNGSCDVLYDLRMNSRVAGDDSEFGGCIFNHGTYIRTTM